METWSDMLRAEGRTEGRAEGRTEGRAAGVTEGRTQGQAALTLSLIEEKFGPVGDAVTHRIRSAGSDELLAWAKRVLTARRVEEVFNGAGG